VTLNVIADIILVYFQATKVAHVAKEKTIELSGTVNESVIKPTKDKVTIGNRECMDFPSFEISIVW
jgi:hypothetical protein